MAKSNLDQLRQLKAGTHRTQTKKQFGYSDVASTREKNKKREVGETWEEKDKDGNVVKIWTQHKGYRSATSPISESIQQIRDILDTYPNCRHSECKSKNKSWIDKKFRALRGSCHLCALEEEDLLKAAGKWEEFQSTKMRENVESFFADSDQYIEELRKDLSNKKEYSGEGGVVETWSANQKMAMKMINEYTEYKKHVLEQLEGDINA